MTTFWPKRDEDGRHVSDNGDNHINDNYNAPKSSQNKPKCKICNDTGTTVPAYESYDGSIAYYRIKCECIE